MSHMKGSVNYGQVADEIAQILADYGDHAVKVLNEEAEKSGEACAKALRKVPRKADQSGNRTETAGRANW